MDDTRTNVAPVQSATEPPSPAPAVAWAAPPPGRAEGRSVLAAIAGVLLVIGGVLGGLAGLAITVIGSAVVQSLGDLGSFPEFPGVDAGSIAEGVILFVGLLILVYSLVYVVAGIGVLRSRNWGRILGLVVGILSGLIWLGSVLTPESTVPRDSVIGSLIAFGIHAYIVVALLFFWRSRPATA